MPYLHVQRVVPLLPTIHRVYLHSLDSAIRASSHLPPLSSDLSQLLQLFSDNSPGAGRLRPPALPLGTRQTKKKSDPASRITLILAETLAWKAVPESL